MCGKFIQMASWSDVADVSRALTADRRNNARREGGGGDEAEITATPMRFAQIMRLNAAGAREMVAMRWGFSNHRSAGPARPDHMHARAETIDTRPTFREAFATRRGILPVCSFNEGEAVGKKTRQWTITPKDGKPIAIAVIYEEWVNGDERLLTFVQVTTPANALIGRITDRMPAILPDTDAQALWLGETRAPLEEVKAVLAPFDCGDGWEMEAEPPRMGKRRSGERGLF